MPIPVGFVVVVVDIPTAQRNSVCSLTNKYVAFPSVAACWSRQSYDISVLDPFPAVFVSAFWGFCTFRSFDALVFFCLLRSPAKQHRVPVFLCDLPFSLFFLCCTKILYGAYVESGEDPKVTDDCATGKAFLRRGRGGDGLEEVSGAWGLQADTSYAFEGTGDCHVLMTFLWST